MLNFKIQSTTRIILLTSILSFVGCTENPYLDLEGAPQDSDNSLTKVWTGTYNGVPNFDEMTLEDLKPALNQAMAINLIEIENIANQSTNPNFDNTIVALERTGKVLDSCFKLAFWITCSVTSFFKMIKSGTLFLPNHNRY